MIRNWLQAREKFVFPDSSSCCTVWLFIETNILNTAICTTNIHICLHLNRQRKTIELQSSRFFFNLYINIFYSNFHQSFIDLQTAISIVFYYVIKLTDFITKNEFYMYIVHTIVSYFLPLYSILRTNFICILYIQCYLCFICFAIIKYHKNITRHVFIDLRNRHMQEQKTHSLLDLWRKVGFVKMDCIICLLARSADSSS